MPRVIKNAQIKIAQHNAGLMYNDFRIEFWIDRFQTIFDKTVHSTSSIQGRAQKVPRESLRTHDRVNGGESSALLFQAHIEYNFLAAAYHTGAY